VTIANLVPPPTSGGWPGTNGIADAVTTYFRLRRFASIGIGRPIVASIGTESTAFDHYLADREAYRLGTNVVTAKPPRQSAGVDRLASSLFAHGSSDGRGNALGTGRKDRVPGTDGARMLDR
jgi:hypothetical protein